MFPKQFRQPVPRRSPVGLCCLVTLTFKQPVLWVEQRSVLTGHNCFFSSLLFLKIFDLYFIPDWNNRRQVDHRCARYMAFTWICLKEKLCAKKNSLRKQTNPNMLAVAAQEGKHDCSSMHACQMSHMFHFLISAFLNNESRVSFVVLNHRLFIFHKTKDEEFETPVYWKIAIITLTLILNNYKNTTKNQLKLKKKLLNVSADNTRANVPQMWQSTAPGSSVTHSRTAG